MVYLFIRRQGISSHLQTICHPISPFHHPPTSSPQHPSSSPPPTPLPSIPAPHLPIFRFHHPLPPTPTRPGPPQSPRLCPGAAHGLFSPKPPEGAGEQRAGRVPPLPPSQAQGAPCPSGGSRAPRVPGLYTPCSFPSPPRSHRLPLSLADSSPTRRAQGCPRTPPKLSAGLLTTLTTERAPLAIHQRCTPPLPLFIFSPRRGQTAGPPPSVQLNRREAPVSDFVGKSPAGSGRPPPCEAAAGGSRHHSPLWLTGTGYFLPPDPLPPVL